jgi:hypothetical protein
VRLSVSDFLVALYPESWRHRYGEEYREVLGRRLRLTDAADSVLGALRVRRMEGDHSWFARALARGATAAWVLGTCVMVFGYAPMRPFGILFVTLACVALAGSATVRNSLLAPSNLRNTLTVSAVVLLAVGAGIFVSGPRAGNGPTVWQAIAALVVLAAGLLSCRAAVLIGGPHRPWLAALGILELPIGLPGLPLLTGSTAALSVASVGLWLSPDPRIGRASELATPHQRV